MISLRVSCPRCALVAVCATLAFATGSLAKDRPRAHGGTRLVETAERAAVTVVGTIREPIELDRHGRAAQLEVERRLRGPVSANTTIRIAWEELSSARAARFASGDYILVSLEALPSHSLWRTRIPDTSERGKTLAVAAKGDAFLRSPSAGTLALLEHYLALANREREGPAGTGYLCELVQRSELPVARDAVRRLAARSQLDDQLGKAGASALVLALLRSEPELSEAVVALIGSHALESTRQPLESAALLQPQPVPALYDALARLPGGLTSEQRSGLLASESAEQRAIAASDTADAAALEALLRSDPSPLVRERAVEQIATLGGPGAVDALIGGLADSEPIVRSAAARRLGALGDAAVSSLRYVVDGNDPEAAAAAVAALSLSTSPSALGALSAIAEAHEDEALRTLARLAIGQAIGDEH